MKMLNNQHIYFAFTHNIHIKFIKRFKGLKIEKIIWERSPKTKFPIGTWDDTKITTLPPNPTHQLLEGLSGSKCVLGTYPKSEDVLGLDLVERRSNFYYTSNNIYLLTSYPEVVFLITFMLTPRNGTIVTFGLSTTFVLSFYYRLK